MINYGNPIRSESGAVQEDWRDCLRYQLQHVGADCDDEVFVCFCCSCPFMHAWLKCFWLVCGNLCEEEGGSGWCPIQFWKGEALRFVCWSDWCQLNQRRRRLGLEVCHHHNIFMDRLVHQCDELCRTVDRRVWRGIISWKGCRCWWYWHQKRKGRNT